MVYLRNIYLEYIYNNLSNYDYTIVYDFDLYGNIYEDGIYNTFYNLLKDNTIDAIGSNSFKYYNFIIFDKKTYRDPYAFIRYDIKSINDIMYNNHKMKTIDNLLKTDSLKRVISCFGGLMIYRTSSIYNKYHNTSYVTDNIVLCEHVGLNNQLSNVYINPVFEYNILYNPTPYLNDFFIKKLLSYLK